MLHRLQSALKLFGIDLRQAFNTSRALATFLRQRRSFIKRSQDTGSEFPMGKLYPCLDDASDKSGTARGHYFYQDWLVANAIFKATPARHVDVGSRVDGFVAHVASFRQIEVFDIRPLRTSVPNIVFHQLDLMNELDPVHKGICDSLSCLHALEHFGLGRYGDALDPMGHVKAFKNLALMLQDSGTLYFSVPIGASRVEFNAHRVFGLDKVQALWQSGFTLIKFHFVDDSGDLHFDQDFDKLIKNPGMGLNYGCGIFELRKNSESCS